jgi:hypothetical protein
MIPADSGTAHRWPDASLRAGGGSNRRVLAGLAPPTDERLSGGAHALSPGGVLAVWSAGGDTAFARQLCDAGFAVDEVAVRARSHGKGPRHIIWFARKG